jgi:hypothetical protein
MTRAALDSGKGKRGSSAATWAKVKYDRQIVAMAKVAGATTIDSDDKDLRTLAKASKIDVVGLAELPLPPQKAQLDLELVAGGAVVRDTSPSTTLADFERSGIPESVFQ